MIARNEGVAVLMQLCSCEKPAILRFACVVLTNMSAIAGACVTLLTFPSHMMFVTITRF